MTGRASTQLFTQADATIWLQVGGAIPGIDYKLLACGETTDTELSRGDREAIIRKDLNQRGAYYIAGKKYATPEMHSTGLRMEMPRGAVSVLERLMRTGCDVTIQCTVGRCTTPEDFHRGWESVLIYEEASLSSLSIPSLGGFTGEKDDVLIEGSMTFMDYGRVTRMRFQEKFPDLVPAEVLDGLFCGAVECGNCGSYSDGCQRLYVLTRANPGSPGLSSQLVYTNDLLVGAAIDIPPFGGLDGNRLVCVGDCILVISEAAQMHAYIQREAVMTAAGWQGVTSGYVAGHGPRAVFVLNPTEIFFASAGGYIYKSTNYQALVEIVEDATITTEDFNDIDGDGGDVLYAVANNNVVVKSINRGETWQLLTGPQAGSDLQTVWVMDEYNLLVGGTESAFYRSNDGGVTWHAVNYANGGAADIIHDIKFSRLRSVGYAAIESGGVGYVYRTKDAGTNWFRDDPHIAGLDDNARIRFVAPCLFDENVVAAGGLATGSTDGYLAVASGSG